MKFKHNIEVQSGIADNNNLTGDSGQILSSTGSGVEWIDQNAITSSSDFIFFNVKNETGSTINKGKGVMAVGTDGNSGHILIDEMVADGSIESKYFLGVLETTVANGGFARVISFGQLDQFNTLGQNGETWNDGDILWCDPDSAGDFTITEPDGPNVKIAAAIILNSSTNGKIQVRVQANEGIHDLHDTKITSQVDGDVLVWDDTTGVWFNDSTLNVDYTAGRVGIGTTSPDSILHIKKSAAPELKLESSVTTYNTVSSKIGFYGGYDSNLELASIRVKELSSGGIGGGLGIFTTVDPNTPQEIITISSLGSVGIGTTSPSEKLNVSGNILATGTILGSNLSGTNTGDQDLSGYALTSHNHDDRYYTESESDSRFVNVTGDTITGTLTISGADAENALTISGTSPTMAFTDTGSEDDFYIHVNSNNFYVLRDSAGGGAYGNWTSPSPLRLEGDTNTGYLFDSRIFADNYHPNADKWTTARTLSLTGDASGSVSWDGSANASLSVAVNNNSHTHTWDNILGETANSVNSWGGLRHQTNDGYIDFGPANSSYAHIYTDRPSFYFNKSLIVNGDSTINTTDIRAGIFYDNDNTGYYLDPAGTSRLGYAHFDGYDDASGNARTSTGVSLGRYTSDFAHIDIASSNSNGGWIDFSSASGGDYGGRIRYHNGSDYMSFYAGGANEEFRINSTYTTSLGSSRAPIFYDSNNTGYYVNPAGNSQFSAIYYNEWLRNNRSTATGLYWESVSPGNGWHIYPENRQDMTFRTGSGNGGIKGTIADGTARGYVHWTTSNEIGFLNNSRSWSLRVDASGNSFSTASSRAPIFYDSNNTSYYLDPASTGTSATFAGSIGIGTTSPGKPLHIQYNDQAISRIRIQNTGTNGSAYDLVAGIHNSYQEGFSIYNATLDKKQFNILNNGNVGIDEVTPNAKLTVFRRDTTYAVNLSDAQSRAGLSVKSSGSFDSKLTISSGASSRQYIQGVNNAATTGRDICINPFGGNVGIGTTSPSQKLQVSGNIMTSALYLNNGTSLYLGATFFGSRVQVSSSGGLSVIEGSTYKPVYASAFTVSSDYRLKSNIVPLDNAISRLNQLEVHRFNWNDRLDEPKVDGFIAHEVATVIPEAVLGEKDGTFEDGTPDYQGIDQAKIVPLLTAALQEALQKIENLETRIQTLENN